VGEGDGDEHGFLLAGRAIGGGLIFGGHDDGQIIAVGAGEGAACGAVLAAVGVERFAQGFGGEGAAGGIGQRGAREGGGGECLQLGVERGDQGGAGLRQRAAELGDLGFDGV